MASNRIRGRVASWKLVNVSDVDCYHIIIRGTLDTSPGAIARSEKFVELLCTREENKRINAARKTSEKKRKLELSRIDTGGGGFLTEPQAK